MVGQGRDGDSGWVPRLLSRLHPFSLESSVECPLATKNSVQLTIVNCTEIVFTRKFLFHSNYKSAITAEPFHWPNGASHKNARPAF